MAGYKETPRQKMIGMMYLVLTALLALNVSVEILNAFLVVNESMETTNKTFSSKTTDYYRSFEQQYANDSEKVRPYWEKAKQARKLSEDLKNYLNDVKFEAIAKSEKISIDSAKVRPLYRMKSKDRYDETTVYLIGNSQDGSKGKAGEMKLKIKKYKEDLLNLIEPGERANIKIGLDLTGPFYDADRVKQNWEMHNFYHTILAADVTILNKLVAEVQNAELDVVTHLRSKIGAADFKIDQLSAAVVPKSQYVFMGENYEAEVFVTARDTKQEFTANIGGLRTSENGIIKVTLPATSPGPKSVTGTVNYKKPDGTIESYPVKFDYIVAPPSLSVSATKMNVFYIGVDNPVSISAGGVSPDQISASITNGSITRSGGAWIVRPDSPGKAIVSVSAKLGDRMKSMGAVEYRVKNVPNPEAYIANTSGGVVSRDLLLASGAIIPRMPADFEFNLNFVIVSFSFSGNSKGDVIDYTGSGNILTTQMKDFIRRARPREKIILEDIFAKGPDGKTRKLNSIVLTLQ
ncbi:MAG: gliding motility protein GldM [Lentimicrobiaceae bacterium]|jgi:gliding motility-associated protein GldM